MSGNGNGNGKGDHDHDSSVLEAVEQRLAERQLAEAAGEPDPVHGWKQIPLGHPVTLAQLHTGLMAVSQISEAAIEGGIKMAGDLRHALPVMETVSTQLRSFTTDLQALQTTLNSCRKDIQSLKDDVRGLADTVRLVPAIKSMLADVLVRLPDPES